MLSKDVCHKCCDSFPTGNLGAVGAQGYIDPKKPPEWLCARLSTSANFVVVNANSDIPTDCIKKFEQSAYAAGKIKD
jgi:hypothetical protein